MYIAVGNNAFAIQQHCFSLTLLTKLCDHCQKPGMVMKPFLPYTCTDLSHDLHKSTFIPLWLRHTLSITFRQLPPNSARFSYATEGALFISMQLSSNVVSALQKVQVL